MCRGLIIFVIGWFGACSVFAIDVVQEEQDLNCGPLIFNIVRILAVKQHLDEETRVALGASLEYLFLQLQRSKTDSAVKVLANTAVLKLDAGGAESRTEAILAKGARINAELKMVEKNYDHLCSSDVAVQVCRGREETSRYLVDLQQGLKKR